MAVEQQDEIVRIEVTRDAALVLYAALSDLEHANSLDGLDPVDRRVLRMFSEMLGSHADMPSAAGFVERVGVARRSLLRSGS